MKEKTNIYQSSKFGLARMACLLVACLSIAMAQAADISTGIYSWALDRPEFPADTVDPQLKALSAGAWYMIDADNGQVLSSKNADKRMYPASMTKMMTCILACESGRLGEIITISAAAAAVPYGYVKRGEKYVLRDLLYRVMLPSDNGAAHAVGEFLSNDSVSFATMMNQKAKELGMTGTHFVNAHGLPDDNHYTTAHDMMRLVKYCMKNKDFAEIVSNSARDVTTTTGKVIHLKSTNRLYGRYDGCIGVKTGTTRAAGGCLASAVVRDGIKIYLVIMKCEPARVRTDESIVLYDKGFEMAKAIRAKKGKKSRNASARGKNGEDKRPVPRSPKTQVVHDELMKKQNQPVPNRQPR